MDWAYIIFSVVALSIYAFALDVKEAYEERARLVARMEELKRFIDARS